MRMTNKIMQNNSLYNINNNKILQDKLSTQMSTQKKLTRPSDDPVVAIRALRLRTSVSELSQYYDKNAPDAESWLEVTGKALGTVTDVLTDMSKQANKGSNKDLTSADLQIIVEQMKSLRDEFYSTGNVDYAGRYVFTGFRTDTPMSFTKEVEDNPPSYEITEQNTIANFDSINYTDIDSLEGLNKNNYTGVTGLTEQNIFNSDIHRMRLSYDNLDDSGVSITYTDTDGNSKTITPTIVSTDATPDPYHTIQDANLLPSTDSEANKVVFVPETGELLFSNEAYDKLNGSVNTNTEIRITYTKDQWRNGDLRPEHYFACKETKIRELSESISKKQISEGEFTVNGKSIETPIVFHYTEGGTAKTITPIVGTPDAIPTTISDTDENIYYDATSGKFAFGKAVKDKLASNDVGKMSISYKKSTIDYNQEYLQEGKEKQVIEYDVGYNQKIRVNTTADEVFNQNLDRDIDDLEKALTSLVDIEATRSDLDNLLKDLQEGEGEYDLLKKQYDAADKAYSYIRENIHKLFERNISGTQGYLDATNVAITDNGTRSQRLDLISNRLMDQKTTFKTLQSENEDADLAEVAVQLTSTELTYEAALMATGKIMQTSLMNYI